ncbi:hypothetical protein Cob_v000936 [Colletotrichum orbiculare MAFF 240422]|uniref:Uncharacterized protein n=1 Tax=Colletotrichum orbiculare (strain 104-T / ATCC 96160 / CBS 514.97 / LARS 414 / MAFF 240422) TaxID=1213857 RepID=A0A484G9V3_COLOR|nr:hypothetical protein Cob_v000936 [Colletotrichum orbiculare MAFF 240422]
MVDSHPSIVQLLVVARYDRFSSSPYPVGSRTHIRRWKAAINSHNQTHHTLCRPQSPTLLPSFPESRTGSWHISVMCCASLLHSV